MQPRMIWAITVSAGTCALAGTGVATASTGHGVFGFHPTPAVKTVVVAAKDSSATTPKKKRVEIIDKVVRVKTTNAAGADIADSAVDPVGTGGGSLAGESASAADIEIPDPPTTPTTPTTPATPSKTPSTQKPTATTVDDDETDDDVATTTVTTVAKKADPATTVKAPTTTVKPGASTTTQSPATTAKPNTATTRPPIPANCREPQWEHGRWKCDGQEND
jgi:hypothetical protein